jgi:enoyl-CoA hydratase/carnithine racemase
VRLVLGEPVARLVLDRPDRRNALSLAVMRSMTAALDAIAADSVARVVVLEGNGPAFSAGHDIAEMVATNRGVHQELFSTCVTLMQRLHEIPQPVIAKVRGVATAAGCQLVAAAISRSRPRRAVRDSGREHRPLLLDTVGPRVTFDRTQARSRCSSPAT